MRIVLDFLSMTLKLAVSVVLLLMALLTGADVIGRYLFNRPVAGTDELVAVGMAILIFGSLPLVAAQSGQITVDIGTGLLRGRARSVQEIFLGSFGAVVLGFLAFQLFILAAKMMRNADYSSMLHFPYGPLVYVMAVMAALAALVTLVLAFCPIVERRGVAIE